MAMFIDAFTSMLYRIDKDQNIVYVERFFNQLQDYEHKF